MNWYDALLVLLRSVANGQSGQVGSIVVKPPDERVAVTLSASAGKCVVTAEGIGAEYASEAEAASAYAAAIEGHA